MDIIRSTMNVECHVIKAARVEETSQHDEREQKQLKGILRRELSWIEDRGSYLP
jgi:hypothetical protein